MIGSFHFLRPWALLAIVPAALLWWRIQRRQSIGRAWRGIIAPRLLPYLLTGADRRTRFAPQTLLGLGWCLAIIAVAGPAWRRQAAPFVNDVAALAVVVKVAPSMKTEDVQPSRLTRSVQKIHDLLALRPGAKTALIAYSGSAHLVMPPATDAALIDTFAAALDPGIMPAAGDAAAEALRMAGETLAGAGAGSILWVTDSIASEEYSAIAAWRKTSGTRVELLAPLYEGAELATLRGSSKAAGAHLVRLTPDDADVKELARITRLSVAAATSDPSSRWEEDGYWLVPVLAVLMLPFARRGWMVSTAARS